MDCLKQRWPERVKRMAEALVHETDPDTDTGARFSFLSFSRVLLVEDEVIARGQPGKNRETFMIVVQNETFERVFGLHAVDIAEPFFSIDKPKEFDGWYFATRQIEAKVRIACDDPTINVFLTDEHYYGEIKAAAKQHRLFWDQELASPKTMPALQNLHAKVSAPPPTTAARIATPNNLARAVMRRNARLEQLFEDIPELGDVFMKIALAIDVFCRHRRIDGKRVKVQQTKLTRAGVVALQLAQSR